MIENDTSEYSNTCDFCGENEKYEKILNKGYRSIRKRNHQALTRLQRNKSVDVLKVNVFIPLYREKVQGEVTVLHILCKSVLCTFL